MSNTKDSIQELKDSLSEDKLKQLMTALKEVMRLARSDEIKTQLFSGICCAWQWQLDENNGEVCYSLVMHLAADWPLSRKPGVITSYPVPENDSIGKWVGKNLELRLNLMRYILRRLRDWHRRAKE